MQTGFQRAITVIILARMSAVLIPYPPASRKAGYVCTQRYAPLARCTALQVQICFVHGSAYHRGSTSAHKSRSPRKQGRGNHAIGNRPGSASVKARFLPASTQDWASQANTRSFTGVPFRGFLGPPSETADLTRILRRRLALVSIAHLAALCNHFCIYTRRLEKIQPSGRIS